MNAKIGWLLLLLACQGFLAMPGVAQAPPTVPERKLDLPPLKLGPGALEPIAPESVAPDAALDKIFGTEPGRGGDPRRAGAGAGSSDLWLDEVEIGADDRMARDLLASDAEPPSWETALMGWIVGGACFLILIVGFLAFSRRRETH